MQSPETIVVTDLQRSQWSHSYYMNVGVVIRALDDSLFPLTNYCGIYLRADELMANVGELLGPLLSLEYPITDSSRRADLSALLQAELLPVLDRCTKLAFLRSNDAKKILSRAFVESRGARLLANHE
jgi:hypothetical protein